jgi:hypothetical protein
VSKDNRILAFWGGAGPRHVGTPGRLIIWLPLKQIFFKSFRRRTWLAKFLRARAPITDNFRRNSFACGNLSLLAPHFILYQWRLSAPYRLVLREAARLARPLGSVVSSFKGRSFLGHSESWKLGQYVTSKRRDRITDYCSFLSQKGHAMAQLVEPLRYKPEARGLDSRWNFGIFGIFHWRNPSDRTMTLGSTQPLSEVSTRNIYWG